MTHEFLEQNYVYITNKLYDDYPGLSKRLNFFNFSHAVNNCLGIIDTWSQDDVIDLFYEFTKGLPASAPIGEAVKVIANKFIIILSWDMLIDKLVGGLSSGAKPMTFAFGSNERIWLHDVILEDTNTNLTVTFCDTISSRDKVQAEFQLWASYSDRYKSWKDMTVRIHVTNLELPVMEMAAVTMAV